jgi:sterol desaturase/sphingolipid hydroxylase (fatty acid hydroxylase superfamily)
MLIQILIGLLAANILEWVVHKYLLHEWGKKKSSMFSFHWRDHHRITRKEGFIDKSVSTKEVFAVLLLCFILSPIYYLLPIFYIAMFFHAMVYLVIHNISHRYPKWAFRNFRWHYDHHMGTDQDKNWCVVHPLADYIFGTRRKYEYKK